MDARNDLTAPLTKVFVALETARRRDEPGRVAGPVDFLARFFPHDERSAEDRLFPHLPNEVRGPILFAWGVRGKRSALRDDDAKVTTVVHDALLAGDLDAEAIERGISPETLLAWLPLADWWAFWRAGKLDKRALLMAFELAYEARLFDAPWLFGVLASGQATGIDVIGSVLSKEDVLRWMNAVHASGDGSPAGLLAALGWPTLVDKASTPLLVGVLDAFAARVGVLAPLPQTERRSDAQAERKAEVRKAREAAPREPGRKPEPSRPPEPSVRAGARASRPPPAIPITVDDDAGETTDQYRVDALFKG